MYEIETDDEVIEWIDDYNSKIFPTKSADYILFTYINTMVLSIDSFLKNVIEINNKTKIKKILNSEIKKIIKNKYCYIIGKNSINKRIFKISSHGRANIDDEYYPIIKLNNKLYIANKNNSTRISFDEFSEIKYINEYNKCKQFYKIINKKIKELNMGKSYCHICYSRLTNNKKQKCDNCKKIYKLIKEIDETRNTNNITSRIKGKKIYEKDLTIERKRQRRHTNLIRFVKDLEDKIEQENKKDLIKLNTINTKTTEFPTEKIKQLYHLIEYGFGEKNNKI